MPDHIVAFDPDELAIASAEVSRLRKALQGRKLEEGDWTEIYCKVRNAPNPGWSNLPFRDYLHNGVGVEFKLLMKNNPSSCIGRAIMHPAATRRIYFNNSDPAETAMEMVIAQWGEAIKDFERRVRKTSPTGDADIRWGILLWARDLSELLYFEERLTCPKAEDFRAEWFTGNHRGNKTRSLRIYEKKTDRLAFSCTGESSGRKLQPYFVVPDIAHGAHIFQPEHSDTVPLFVDRKQADRFQKLFADDHENAFERLLDLWEQSDP